jgi:hypothetical protein
LVLGVLAVAAGVERVALVEGVQVVAGVVVCAPPDEGIGVPWSALLMRCAVLQMMYGVSEPQSLLLQLMDGVSEP